MPGSSVLCYVTGDAYCIVFSICFCIISCLLLSGILLLTCYSGTSCVTFRKHTVRCGCDNSYYSLAQKIWIVSWEAWCVYAICGDNKSLPGGIHNSQHIVQTPKSTSLKGDVSWSLPSSGRQFSEYLFLCVLY